MKAPSRQTHLSQRNGCCPESSRRRGLPLTAAAAAARGELVAPLAAEGGLPAVLWSGPERGSQGSRLRLGFAGETLSYAIELGYRADDETSAFLLDPEIKREWIWAGGAFHPRNLLVQRNGAVVERCGWRYEFRPELIAFGRDDGIALRPMRRWGSRQLLLARLHHPA